ncbi:MAG: carboxypeptidase-like regulatory domain-containing protein [Gemmatimonadaceae bacterium]|nr:carboxypeptidase-like regulatory domain-containing protein [Gemmatimonadaceae bacterium]
MFAGCIGLLSSCWLSVRPLARVSAQDGGTVVGVVVHATSQLAIESARLEVEGTRVRAVTDRDGRFRLADVPAGARTLMVSWMSSGSQRVPIQVAKRGTIELRIEYRSHPFALSEIRVTAGSRVPQWVVEAPIAIAVVDRVEARNYAATGQLPQVIKGLPGHGCLAEWHSRLQREHVWLQLRSGPAHAGADGRTRPGDPVPRGSGMECAVPAHR